jgi:hypothetical protein
MAKPGIARGGPAQQDVVPATIEIKGRELVVEVGHEAHLGVAGEHLVHQGRPAPASTDDKPEHDVPPH